MLIVLKIDLGVAVHFGIPLWYMFMQECRRKASSAGGEAAAALSYALGLIDAPARLSRADSAAGTICLEVELSAGIAETWSDALTSHTGRHIRIESTRRTSGS